MGRGEDGTWLEGQKDNRGDGALGGEFKAWTG